MRLFIFEATGPYRSGAGPWLGRVRAPARFAVDCPITTSGAAPLIVDGFRRVRRSTFTEGAIIERAEYKTTNGGSRRATPCNAVQRRTRRSALAFQGAARDTAVGRLTAAPRGSASLKR